ncbi:MAG TPA: hypothetical protein VGG33_13005, partial [Polyangia bacterium]
MLALAVSSCVDLTRPGFSRPGVATDADVSVEPVGGTTMTPASRFDGGVGGTPIDGGGGGGQTGSDGGQNPLDQRLDQTAPVDQAPVVVDMARPPDVPPAVPDAGGGTPAKLALGAACSTGSVCQSGICADGVCCDNSCGSLCQSCRLAGQVGSCRSIPAGADPDNECEESSVQSCGRDGVCNGAGACRLRSAGTVCGNVSCTGSTESEAPKCNGSGQCVAGATRSCGAYLCGGASCGTSCASSAACAGGNLCSGGTCVPTTAVLVVDDFADGNLVTSTMGGSNTWDNQNVTLVNGEVRFAWNGVSVFQDFISAFNSNFCAYDLRQFRTVRFRMRSSSGSKPVRVLMTFSNGTCSADSNPVLRTVTVTPTMTSFDIDL